MVWVPEKLSQNEDWRSLLSSFLLKDFFFFFNRLLKELGRNYLFPAETAGRTVVIHLELVTTTGGINARFSQ